MYLDMFVALVLATDTDTPCPAQCAHRIKAGEHTQRGIERVFYAGYLVKRLPLAFGKTCILSRYLLVLTFKGRLVDGGIKPGDNGCVCRGLGYVVEEIQRCGLKTVEEFSLSVSESTLSSPEYGVSCHTEHLAHSVHDGEVTAHM